MTMTLERLTDQLPAGFARLKLDADADGHRHMARLAAEFADNPAMFHTLVACYCDGELAGIGAITDEPAATSRPTWRMRRLYVHRNVRRRKVARTIAEALLQEATAHDRAVTVHAGNDVAARFWEAMGFRPVAGRSWSHESARCAP